MSRIHKFRAETTMSARALRKVLNEQESAKNQDIILSDDDESESPSNSPRPSSINPFDLLNEEEEQEKEQEQVRLITR